ncbi:MAG TPA: phospholipid carrier-dependent glycosyltransferase, partial [Tepidisphaeraceae bacterium]|nr:phospholipid carrier-dependent glycosyltransferase [Tepidisphaeraceae bacterium]
MGFFWRLASPHHRRHNTPRMVPSGSLPELAVRNRVTDAIVRYRKVFFFGIALLYLISFNGRWRIGLDSSIYRGLGHNLATGKGYVFGESAPHQVYPGLPMALAGIERFISDSVFFPIAPVLLMNACALLTLIVTYKLMRLHFPQWVAVAVVCGVAVNERFLQHANEILTDVPFLLGVVTALYGWSLLRLTTDRKKLWKPILILVVGVALAAVMRPTFW